MSLPKTYLFRLHLADGVERLHPVLCDTHSQALSRARQWLDQNEDCQAVDVLFGETELFLVGRAD